MGLEQQKLAVIETKVIGIEKTLSGFSELMESSIRLQEKMLQQQKEIDYSINLARTVKKKSEDLQEELNHYKGVLKGFRIIYGLFLPAMSASISAVVVTFFAGA